MSGWHILICAGASFLGSLSFLAVVGREVETAEKNLETLAKQLEKARARRVEAREAAERIAAKQAAQEKAEAES